MTIEKSKYLEFKSSDGATNRLAIWIPNTDLSHTIILCLPAMGVPAQKYFTLMESFAERGYTAACYDLRGNGFSSVRASRTCDFGYKELVELDLPAAIKCLRKQHPDKKLVLFGHSLGGQIAVLHLTHNRESIAGLILSASCSVYYKGWPSPFRWGLLVFTQTASILANLIGYFPGRKFGFGGREARTLMRDWARNARTGDYVLDGSKVDYSSTAECACANTSIPVLAITMADDKLAPATATNYLLSKLESKTVTTEQIQGKHLGLKAADHFNWLRQSAAIATLSDQWIKAIE